MAVLAYTRESGETEAGITGKHAWAILAGLIVAYEFAAEEEQLLSSVVDEWLEGRPIITRAVILALALHLANCIHPGVDPVHLCFLALRRLTWKASIGKTFQVTRGITRRLAMVA